MTRPTKTKPEAFLLRIGEGEEARYRGPFASRAAAKGVASDIRARHASQVRIHAAYGEERGYPAPRPLPELAVLMAPFFVEVPE